MKFHGNLHTKLMKIFYIISFHFNDHVFYLGNAHFIESLKCTCSSAVVSFEECLSFRTLTEGIYIIKIEQNINYILYCWNIIPPAGFWSISATNIHRINLDSLIHILWQNSIASSVLLFFFVHNLCWICRSSCLQ